MHRKKGSSMRQSQDDRIKDKVSLTGISFVIIYTRKTLSLASSSACA